MTFEEFEGLPEAKLSVPLRKLSFVFVETPEMLDKLIAEVTQEFRLQTQAELVRSFVVGDGGSQQAAHDSCGDQEETGGTVIAFNETSELTVSRVVMWRPEYFDPRFILENLATNLAHACAKELSVLQLSGKIFFYWVRAVVPKPTEVRVTITLLGRSKVGSCCQSLHLRRMVQPTPTFTPVLSVEELLSPALVTSDAGHWQHWQDIQADVRTSRHFDPRLPNAKFGRTRVYATQYDSEFYTPSDYPLLNTFGLTGSNLGGLYRRSCAVASKEVTFVRRPWSMGSAEWRPLRFSGGYYDADSQRYTEHLSALSRSFFSTLFRAVLPTTCALERLIHAAPIDVHTRVFGVTMLASALLVKSAPIQPDACEFVVYGNFYPRVQTGQVTPNLTSMHADGYDYEDRNDKEERPSFEARAAQALTQKIANLADFKRRLEEL